MKNFKRNSLFKICIGIAILLIFSVGIGVYLYSIGYFYNNEELIDELKSQNNDSDFVASLLGEKQIVVHYPVTDNEILNNEFKLQAQDKLLNINTTNYQSKYINLDYVLNEYNTCFSVNYNDSKALYSYKQNDTNKIDLNKHIDNYLKDYINNEIIYNVKASKEFNDLVTSIEFYNQVNEGYYTYSLSLVDDKLNVLLGKELNYISFDIPLKDICSHINLDLGLKQSILDKDIIRRRYIDKDKPMVAFTFDDGPHIEETNRLLERLKYLDMVATFYVLGDRAMGSKVQETIVTTIKYGNEIGNHSMSHPRLTSLNDEALKYELYTFKNFMNETYQYDIKTFRPPYGLYSKYVKEGLDQKICLWTVDSLDWKYRNVELTYQEIISNVKDDSVVLLHDIYKESVDAGLLAMEQLLKEGYQFVTVSEYMEFKGISSIE